MLFIKNAAVNRKRFIFIYFEAFIEYLIKNLTLPHYILIIFWTFYYVLHSVLAATSVKRMFKEKLDFDRYYRLSYTSIVTILLGLIIWYQYSIESPLLWKVPFLKLPAFFLFILPGAIITLISLKKYFFLLSGVRSVFQKAPVHELKLNGIHRFVRHPLYTGTILVVLGFFLLFPYLNNLIAVTLLILYIIIGTRFEEKKLVAEFGSQYLEYIKKVPAFIPGLKFRNDSFKF